MCRFYGASWADQRLAAASALSMASCSFGLVLGTPRARCCCAAASLAAEHCSFCVYSRSSNRIPRFFRRFHSFLSLNAKLLVYVKSVAYQQNSGPDVWSSWPPPPTPNEAKTFSKRAPLHHESQFTVKRSRSSDLGHAFLVHCLETYFTVKPFLHQTLSACDLLKRCGCQPLEYLML